MNKIAILLVISSALMHALRNFLTKQAGDKQCFVWWYEVFGLIFFFPVFVYTVSREPAALDSIGPLILVSGLIHFLYWYFLAKSLENGDLSLVYPIMRSSPAVVLLFSCTLLGERVSPLGAAGIVLVALGVYCINMQRLSWAELARPLVAVRRDPATGYALLTLLTVAAYSLVDKVAVGRMPPVVFAFIYPWVSLVLFSIYLRRVKSAGQWHGEWTAHRRPILVCGVLSIFGYLLILIAFTIERVSYIVGLRQLSIVFAVLLGGQLLKEKHKAIRVGASLVIFLGAYLIALGG